MDIPVDPRVIHIYFELFSLGRLMMSKCIFPIRKNGPSKGSQEGGGGRVVRTKQSKRMHIYMVILSDVSLNKAFFGQSIHKTRVFLLRYFQKLNFCHSFRSRFWATCLGGAKTDIGWEG